ncbi:MAG TPA: dihydroneopterin aldolase [Gammaproteobacteria bacterium]|nr:dihydroneopterin aldolase [Gammaproteobacteria bacterium]
MRVWVRLGCTPEEKYNSQLVSINTHVLFSSPPLGVQTDRLSDTVYYLKTIECIQALVKKKSFNLIEHLTSQIYETTYQYLMDLRWEGITLKVSINKVSPPVPGIHGGLHLRILIY